ncbi:MAG TPA: zinc ribbon domain-containing protein [Rhodothermales bacterium]|nr:zinc ribbon domain-containing protein [Rhodothermales bacterium]
MPTYIYRREDGTTFEIQQRITEPALEVDPETGQKVTRVISGSAGLIFKGEGFYLTDYARKSNGAGSGSKEHKNASSEPKPASESGGSSESKGSSDSGSKESKETAA